jgi:hypothetical protein
MNNTLTAEEISGAGLSLGGSRLKEFLDRLPIETNWLAGHRVIWQTGQQNGPDGVGPEDHTHCSALVAAIALDLDIYILRPPNHSQQLLANAQTEWLGGHAYPGPSAADSGWKDLGGSGDEGVLAKAVAAANAGKLVVAGYRQPPVKEPGTGRLVQKSGHVVVVRPQLEKFPADKGPLVTMAGDRNWREIHMGPAFGSHPDAWPNAIRLFVHNTDLETEFSAGDGVG